MSTASAVFALLWRGLLMVGVGALGVFLTLLIQDGEWLVAIPTGMFLYWSTRKLNALIKKDSVFDKIMEGG